MWEAALSVLINSFRPAPLQHGVPDPQLQARNTPCQSSVPLLGKLHAWHRQVLVNCREYPSHASLLEQKISERFRGDRFKSREAMGQVLSFSPSRIEWDTKPGAPVVDMIISALNVVSPGKPVICNIVSRSPGDGGPGIRFDSQNNGIVLEVEIDGQNAVFTVSSKSTKDHEILVDAAIEAIALDVSSNVRSYSYSWNSSSGNDRAEDLFRQSPFGELDSLLGQFFGGGSDVFAGGSRMMPFVAPEDGVENRTKDVPQRRTAGTGVDRIAQELEGMAVQVIMPEKSMGEDRVDWSSLAGYERVKSQVEDAVILGLKHPSMFDKVIAKTRGKSSGNSGTNRPKVVLFEGPPGTGKSSTARIIANETNVPMIHIPLESVVSKWFGESEKQIAKIYELARQLASSVGAKSVILFIDEIDSLVSSRDIGTPHEASKRILSVMLRQIDGFVASGKEPVQTTLICATNRKKDLDSAFLSRVDSSIHFGLPDEASRIKIIRLYAKHLSDHELAKLASITDGLSGRNIKDLCQDAERHWTATVIRSLGHGVNEDEVDVSAPPVETYIESAKVKFNQQIR